VCKTADTFLVCSWGYKLTMVKGTLTIGNKMYGVCLKKYSSYLFTLVLVNHILFGIKIIIFCDCETTLNCSDTGITA